MKLLLALSSLVLLAAAHASEAAAVQAAFGDYKSAILAQKGGLVRGDVQGARRIGSTTFAATPKFLQLYDLDPNLYGD